MPRGFTQYHCFCSSFSVVIMVNARIDISGLVFPMSYGWFQIRDYWDVRTRSFSIAQRTLRRFRIIGLSSVAALRRARRLNKLFAARA